MELCLTFQFLPDSETSRTSALIEYNIIIIMTIMITTTTIIIAKIIIMIFSNDNNHFCRDVIFPFLKVMDYYEHFCIKFDKFDVSFFLIYSFAIFCYFYIIFIRFKKSAVQETFYILTMSLNMFLPL